MYRVFAYGSWSGIKSFDCRLVEGDKAKIYKTEDQTHLSAIRVTHDNANALRSDGSVDEDVKVRRVREMNHLYEQYIHGGRVSKDGIYIHFNGEYSGTKRLAQKSTEVDIRVNGNALIRGTANSETHVWNWEVLENKGSLSINEDEQLTELFNRDCMSLAGDDSIDTIEIVDTVFRSE